MKKLTLALIMAATLASCENKDAPSPVANEQDSEKRDPEVEKFARLSNGNWINQSSGYHAYISEGAILINRMEDDKSTGQVSGWYNSEMRPNTREDIELYTPTGSLSEIRTAALVSKDNQIMMEIDGESYALKEETVKPVETTSSSDPSG